MKKKLLSVLMAAVMVAGVGGVGAAQVKADDEKILGAGIYSASDNFNSYIGKAITNACDGIFKTNIEDGQNDQSTQNNQVDTMLAKGASAVAVSVCDVTAAPTLIQKCKDAGNVPIIFFNKEITDYDVINSYVNAYQVTSTGGDYGAAIQAQMAEAGIRVEIEQVDSAAWTDMKKAGKVTCGIGNWYVDYNDPDSMLYPMSDGRTDLSSSFFHNDEFKQLMIEGIQTEDTAKRQEIYAKADHILTHEQFPVVMLYNETLFYLKKPYVKNFEVTFTYRTMFKDADIEY